MQCTRVLLAECKQCSSVALQPQGDYVSSTTSDGGSLKLYDLSTGYCNYLRTQSKICICSAFSPKVMCIISVGELFLHF